MTSRHIAYVGNFGPENSTENHYAKAFEANGVKVTRIQESEIVWDHLDEWLPIEGVYLEDCDFLLWTHTHGLAPPKVHDAQWWALRRLRNIGVPTVSVHLDRWVGLERQGQTYEPFFSTDFVFTADGSAAARGHFAKVGANHYWLPPAVTETQIDPGQVRPEFVSDLVFVGSWQGGYHPEWDHREKLIGHLMRKWRNIEFWPRRGEHAIRGRALQDLYASVKVVIGDSCLVGAPDCYYSDRIPETVGRGGVLIHPWVDGCLDGQTYEWGESYEREHDLLTYPAYDFGALDAQIERLLDSENERAYLRTNGRAKTKAHHTYQRRAAHIYQKVVG